MERLESLESLLLHEVQDLYSTERQLVKALPKVAKKVSSPELRSAVEQHLQETEEHVNRLEQIFGMLGQKAKSRTCKAMEGILDEADDILKIKGPPETRDAAIIVAAQKVEHYEMAGYGSAAKWAEHMGRNDIKMLLSKTLDEEEKADRRLTELATSGINQKAAQYQSKEAEEFAE